MLRPPLLPLKHNVHEFILGLFFAWLFAGPAAFGQVSVLTQHNDNARTGANLDEPILTPSNVNAKQFGLLFKRVVDDQVYGQPLYVPGVRIAGAEHNVVYVTTVNNSVYAFDADDAKASEPYWHVNFGLPANLADGNFGCTDINGNMGIIGTPVIDVGSGALYVVALTKTAAGFVQRLHALDITTGADLPNSPAIISAEGFNPLFQNQRPALLLLNGVVYVGYASHCDKGSYHGFLIGYDAKSMKRIALFNPSPTGNAASIWQSGQGPAADASGNIYWSPAMEAGMGSRISARVFSSSMRNFMCRTGSRHPTTSSSIARTMTLTPPARC
jgi:hypothetical protein